MFIVHWEYVCSFINLLPSRYGDQNTVINWTTRVVVQVWDQHNTN